MIFRGQNFDIIGGGGLSIKVNNFGGMKILLILCSGHHKIGVFSFLKVSVQNGNIFGDMLKFQVFLGVCLIFFLGNSRCCSQTCVARKKKKMLIKDLCKLVIGMPF